MRSKELSSYFECVFLSERAVSVITERNIVSGVSEKLHQEDNVVLHLYCFCCVNLIHIPTKWYQSKEFVSKLALLHIKSKLSTR